MKIRTSVQCLAKFYQFRTKERKNVICMLLIQYCEGIGTHSNQGLMVLMTVSTIFSLSFLTGLPIHPQLKWQVIMHGCQFYLAYGPTPRNGHKGLRFCFVFFLLSNHPDMRCLFTKHRIHWCVLYIKNNLQKPH